MTDDSLTASPSDDPVFTETIDRAQSLLGRLWNIYAGDVTSIGPRSQPVLAYAALAFEHQEAMLVLLRQGLVGSAMTFVRLIFESTVRAGWVLGCATDDQVDAVRHDDAFRFPVMKDMAVAVETRFNLRAIFTTYVTDNWATLNSYTHPGLRQLTARFSKIDVSPEYPPQHVVVAINGSMHWLMLLAILVLRTHGRPADAARVETELITQYGSGRISTLPP